MEDVEREAQVIWDKYACIGASFYERIYFKKKVCKSVGHISPVQKGVQGQNFVNTIRQPGFCTSHYLLDNWIKLGHKIN